MYDFQGDLWVAFHLQTLIDAHTQSLDTKDHFNKSYANFKKLFKVNPTPFFFFSVLYIIFWH